MLNAAAASLASTSLFDRELVRNGAAESDPGTLDPKSARPATAWHPVANEAPVLVLRYGAKGVFPEPDTPGVAGHGRNFLWGGYTPRAGAWQDVDLSAAAAEIDERVVHFKLSAWLGGREDMADHSTVGVTFLDADGMSLGDAFIGPVTNADRDGKTGFRYRETTRLVPRGARVAHITILMVRYEGDSNDGYVDNVSFVLHKSATPAR
jgi:hypothetical protein